MPLLSVLNHPSLPPAHPSGWYLAALSKELAPGTVLTRRFVGQDLVLYRTGRGQAVAVDPHCPHLGAHLGHGGRVVGETLRCPMHGFCFGADGACTSTPYGPRPPRAARTRVWPLLEQDGLVLVFHDQTGAAPAWTPPPLAGDGFAPPRWARFELRGHPQETSENAADLGHFTTVHGYEDVRFDQPDADGPLFRTRGSFRRTRSFGSTRHIGAHIEIQVFGLGYSVVEVTFPELGLKTRQFVCATPTEPDRIELRIAIALRRDFHRTRVHPLLGLLPHRLALALMRRLALREFVRDISADLPFWETKTYVHPPALAAGDGPIGEYRRWARQFYEPPTKSPDTRPGRRTSMTATQEAPCLP